MARSGHQVDTPPPVSGRRLSSPEAILPADVLARVELLRAHVSRLQHFMGKGPAPAPLMRVDGAQPREVYSQAQNLERRANRLAFEQARVVRTEGVPKQQEPGPADVFELVDSALAAILVAEEQLGLEVAVAEESRPESTTPTEVFNAIVEAGGELNNILDEKVSPSDVFQLVTASVHVAAAMQADEPGAGHLPEEPTFEAGKQPVDVYERMQECFALVSDLAQQRGVETLRFKLDPEQLARVTPNDVGDLAALVLEELQHLQLKDEGATKAPAAFHPGRRFPSHVYQRAGLLKATLEDLQRTRAQRATEGE